jgi:hypothetical protein
MAYGVWLESLKLLKLRRTKNSTQSARLKGLLLQNVDFCNNTEIENVGIVAGNDSLLVA